MIEELRVENFKRFRSAVLRMAPLTVLTGANGSGKSSVIQALLLLRQLSGAAGLRSTVQLNGPYGLQLGEASEVLNNESDTAVIRIGARTEGEPSGDVWSFRVPDERSLYLLVEEPAPQIPAELGLPGNGFTYLAAERLGPRDMLETDSAARDDLTVGSKGQFTAQVLKLFERHEVRPGVRHTTTDEQGGIATLLKQVEFWMSDIVRPVEVQADWFPNTNVTTIRFKSPGIRTEWLRPGNMGFGVSYTLPILVAGLSAPASGIFIVENPEAHLHPQGQSRVGGFLARLAGSGLQVLVETHSDHVLNGLRRAVALDRVLPHDQVVVHFFLPDTQDEDSFSRELRVMPDAGLNQWPAGFFDQWKTTWAPSRGRNCDRDEAAVRHRREQLLRGRSTGCRNRTAAAGPA